MKSKVLPPAPNEVLTVAGGQPNELLARYDDFRKESLDRLITPKYKELSAAKNQGDLAGWDSPNANRYIVTFVPYNVLLDADGKIVGKNLHEQELREAIAKLVGM